MAEGQEPADLRAEYEKVIGELKGLRKENADLSTENRTLKAENLFRNAGLVPAQAALFVSANPEGEITLEGVKEFATKFGLIPGNDGKVGENGAQSPDQNAQGQGVQTDATVSGTPELGLIGRAAARPGSGGQPTPEQAGMSTTEWAALAKRNPSAADQALAEGRVRLHEDNFYRNQAKELNLA